MAPLHLFAYSTLLGAELYQSFVMTKLAYKALPNSSFTTLQKRVFPVYFQGQTLLLGLIAFTLPPQGPKSVISSKSNWIPLTVAGGTAALNLFVYGPRSQRLMIERVHQVTRDSKHSTDPGELSVEMQNLNRSFSRAHAMSIHLNLMTIIATLCYGWQVSKLNFGVVR
ncbi:hypothetical protein BU25DRAFT_332863 [Macroventuria anomochaeta]|uniref:Uncharacterized protein n=1 Tax=Macroventuria anomochaeta TaxID=301207 RepID=A0ACB6SD89_9PLEO|nr:uncharacterized protein BU25DRAFT_332863 [Macroventuria anomochaeta]KAF2631570.1 hypothetical protein BU25DRAFT_332863 [Macroventuria anomochaeta]